MNTQPFTADGVTAKMLELQNLSNADLQMETDVMRADFKSWLNANFDLDAAQQAYLVNMDNNFTTELGTDVADCMLFRLNLFVTFHARKPTSSKFILPDSSSLVRSYHPNGGYTVSGQLRIDIKYE